jgi:hypothetical protein
LGIENMEKIGEARKRLVKLPAMSSCVVKGKNIG